MVQDANLQGLRVQRKLLLFIERPAMSMNHTGTSVARIDLIMVFISHPSRRAVTQFSATAGALSFIGKRKI